MTLPRRRFLHAVAGLAVAAPLAQAIEPIVRTGKPHMRLSLAGYSFRQLLSADPKTKAKAAWTYNDFIDFAAGLNLDAVELTSYYFPKDADADYFAGLKGKCIRLGLDVSGSSVGNDFCVSDPEKLKEQMALVRAGVETTARLGGKTLRIFAGKIAAGETEEKARQRCVAAIQEACGHAAKHGVYLALENHGGITATPEQLLAIVKAVKHDWFGVNLDTGNFHGSDPYAELAQLAPYAVNVQVKTEMSQTGQKKEDADLAKVVGLLKAANYRGYVVLEYEAAEDAKSAVPKAIAELQKLLA